MSKKIIRISVDEEIADELVEQIRNFLDDFYGEEASRMEVLAPEEDNPTPKK